MRVLVSVYIDLTFDDEANRGPVNEHSRPVYNGVTDAITRAVLDFLGNRAHNKIASSVYESTGLTVSNSSIVIPEEIAQ